MSPVPSPRTYGISSDLTGAAEAAARAMWDRLETRFGLSGARAAAAPHMSFLVGECDRPAELGPAVAGVAATLGPLPVEITGIRVFEGLSPVVYLAVARTPALAEAHARLLEATEALWAEVWPYYRPDAWTPHVTLALRDLEADRLGDVLDDLRRQPACFAARLERIDLVHVVLPRHRPVASFRLAAA